MQNNDDTMEVPDRRLSGWRTTSPLLSSTTQLSTPDASTETPVRFNCWKRHIYRLESLVASFSKLIFAKWKSSNISQLEKMIAEWKMHKHRSPEVPKVGTWECWRIKSQKFSIDKSFRVFNIFIIAASATLGWMQFLLTLQCAHLKNVLSLLLSFFSFQLSFWLNCDFLNFRAQRKVQETRYHS